MVQLALFVQIADSEERRVTGVDASGTGGSSASSYSRKDFQELGQLRQSELSTERLRRELWVSHAAGLSAPVRGWRLSQTTSLLSDQTVDKDP